MMMAKRALPSLSIAAALVFSVNNTSPSSCDSPRSDSGGTVKEPFTGIEFPCIREDVDHTNYLLIGTAVRCMLGQCKFAKARAYAVGLYVEDAKQVGQWMPKGIQNSNNEVIFSQVLREPIARRLVLVMDKDVAGHHIAKVGGTTQLAVDFAHFQEEFPTVMLTEFPAHVAQIVATKAARMLLLFFKIGGCFLLMFNLLLKRALIGHCCHVFEGLKVGKRLVQEKMLYVTLHVVSMKKKCYAKAQRFH